MRKRIGHSHYIGPQTRQVNFGGNSQIQGRNEFKNKEFPCLLYPYWYKKDNLFWEFPQEKMSKNLRNPMSGGGYHKFLDSPLRVKHILSNRTEHQGEIHNLRYDHTCQKFNHLYVYERNKMSKWNNTKKMTISKY